jgi:hypothetical protein
LVGVLAVALRSSIARRHGSVADRFVACAPSRAGLEASCGEGRGSSRADVSARGALELSRRAAELRRIGASIRSASSEARRLARPELVFKRAKLEPGAVSRRGMRRPRHGHTY